MADSLPIEAGEVLLGKYRVERLLGQGGMGVVLAVRHVDLGELFAIKLLLPEGVENPLAVERFLREARAAARLRGEHVTKVIDVGHLPNGAPYMVMEHLDGSDLRRVMRQRGKLPLDLVITYVLQVCEALAEAHAAGIVHRDIKPANLFLTERPNGTPCIKVLDFGISKQLASQDAAELTRTGDLVGSPLYMSPEQLTRSRSVDTRSDIWSIGMLLYTLLTGKTPFIADSLPEIIGRTLVEEATPPSALRPGLPPAIDAIVARCLRKQPDERYARVEDVAADLRAVLAGHIPALEASGASGGSPRSALPSDTTSPGSAGSSGSRSSAPWLGSNPELGASDDDRISKVRSGVQTSSAWGQTGSRESALPPRSRALLVAAVVVAVAAVAGLSVLLTLRFGGGSGPPGTAAAAATATYGETAPPTSVAPVPPSTTATPEPSTQAAPATPPSASAQPAARSPAKPGAGARPPSGVPGKKHEGIY